MPVQNRHDPSRVRLSVDRLGDRGKLQLEVETDDLGTDNRASIHLYDGVGHVADVALAWSGQRGSKDVFGGEVSLSELERAGFDLASLKQQPCVAYQAGGKVLWGDPQSYDARRYRQRVNDALWRGSSINDADDLRELLSQQRPKTIVTLRETQEPRYNADEQLVADANRGRPAAAQTRLVRIPLRDFSAPSLAQVKQFLDLATDKANQPLYVHCRAGIGRTGVMIAAYRMAVEHWPLDKALAEAKSYGLGDADQEQFLQALPGHLAAGDLPGYPR